MNEIVIRPELAWHEYNALRYGKIGPIGFWTVLAFAVVALASSATLMWGTAASVLAGLALTAFIFILLLTGLFDVKRHRQAYERYRGSDIRYVFANERISVTWRYGESSFDWPAINRVVEKRSVYIFAVGNGYIYIPKRNIQPHDVAAFIQLLQTHGLLQNT